MENSSEKLNNFFLSCTKKLSVSIPDLMYKGKDKLDTTIKPIYHKVVYVNKNSNSFGEVFYQGTVVEKINDRFRNSLVYMNEKNNVNKNFTLTESSGAFIRITPNKVPVELISAQNTDKEAFEKVKEEFIKNQEKEKVELIDKLNLELYSSVVEGNHPKKEKSVIQKPKLTTTSFQVKEIEGTSTRNATLEYRSSIEKLFLSKHPIIYIVENLNEHVDTMIRRNISLISCIKNYTALIVPRTRLKFFKEYTEYSEVLFNTVIKENKKELTLILNTELIGNQTWNDKGKLCLMNNYLKPLLPDKFKVDTISMSNSTIYDRMNHKGLDTAFTLSNALKIDIENREESVNNLTEEFIKWFNEDFRLNYTFAYNYIKNTHSSHIEEPLVKDIIFYHKSKKRSLNKQLTTV